MPTYEYKCKDCDQSLEVVQSFSDDALTVCPNCDGELRKVFSAAGIVFKGSGWHIKDYAAKGGSSTTAPPDGGSSGESSSGSEKSGSEKSAKPSTETSSSKPSGGSSKPSGGSSSSTTTSTD